MKVFYRKTKKKVYPIAEASSKSKPMNESAHMCFSTSLIASPAPGISLKSTFFASSSACTEK